jgi:hypothetical protein
VDPLLVEAIKTLGLPMAVAGYLLWKGSGDKPLWVFGAYFRETLRQTIASHEREMERRDKEYDDSLLRRDVELEQERKARVEWQEKYVSVLETAHRAVDQSVKVFEKTRAVEEGKVS